MSMINLDAIKITPRDEEVLHLLAQGCSNKEIAEACTSVRAR
jgi:DNA-binding NarL/FixJ family response regulator